MLTKKDFNQIALEFRQEFAKSLPAGERAAVTRIAIRMAAALAATNKGFIRAKFLEACGVVE